MYLVVTSPILELAIGVVFVWFLLSVALSALNDGLALLFRIRAKHLWLAVGRIAEPATAHQGRRFWDTVIRLPFSRENYDLRPKAQAEAADEPLRSSLTRKSRLDSSHKNLAQSLQDLYDRLAPNLTDVALNGRKSKLTAIPAELLAGAIAEIAVRVFPADLVAVAPGLNWTPEDLRTLDVAMTNIPADQVLSAADTAALNVAGKSVGDLAALHAKATLQFTTRDLSRWFRDQPAVLDALRSTLTITDTTARAKVAFGVVQRRVEHEMDQLSALYRRQSRKVLAVLAIPFVVFTEANAVSLVQQLHRDDNLRQVVSANATTIAAQSDLDAIVKANCEPSTNAPSPKESTTTTSTTTTLAPFEAARERVSCAGHILGAADEFRLVPDWGSRWKATARRDSSGCCRLWRFARRTVGGTFADYGWFGRPITLVALLFGAQFWFDVLRRLVGLRQSTAASG